MEYRVAAERQEHQRAYYETEYAERQETGIVLCRIVERAE